MPNHICRPMPDLAARPSCEGCGTVWNTLFDTFTTGIGWRRLCGKCSDPGPHGPARAYSGPYPITRKSNVMSLVCGGGAS